MLADSGEKSFVTLPVFPKSSLDRSAADGIPAATVPTGAIRRAGNPISCRRTGRIRPTGLGSPDGSHGRPRREWGKRSMRKRYFLGTMLVTAALIAAPVPAQAQGLSDYYVPSTPSVNAPIPTGNPRSSGVFVAAEFVFLSQSRTLENQVIAVRGFFDAGGLITGTPGTFVGSGTTALQTNDMGRSSYAPGYRVTVGWKTEDNMSFYLSFMQTVDTKYNAGASITPPGFRGPFNLADSFISSPVFNFNPNYAGPLSDTNFDDPDPTTGTNLGNTYGIWNAADEMTIEYQTRFTAGDIGVRMPMFQTEFSRIYSIGGLRYSWFFERFAWRTADRDINGVATDSDSAVYKNTLSQRMYGPFIGCGHEVYLGKALAVSMDVTASALLSVIKERVQYKLGDPLFPTTNKKSRNTFNVVPNMNADVNAWWYPLEGVQIRAGYSAMMFLNTNSMETPVTFDFGAMNANYGTQVFRLVHGFNVGVGLFF